MKFTLPEDFKLPEGVTINDSDPLFVAAREIVVKHANDPIEMGNAFFHLKVKADMDKHAADKAWQAGELKTLGSSPGMRVGAVSTFLTANTTEQRAKAIMRGMFEAEAILGLEDVMRKFSSQGASTPPAGAHTPASPPPRSIAEQIWPRGFSQQKVS